MSAPAEQTRSTLTSLEELTERGAAALDEYRKRALEAARSIGLPSTRDDRWKFTPLNRIASLDLVRGESEGIDSSIWKPLEIEDAVNVVLVNGRRIHGDETPDRVRITELTTAHLIDEFRPGDEWHPFAAWNAASFEEGLLIEAESGGSGGTINLIHVATNRGGGDVFAAPRVRVIVDQSASLTVVEQYVSTGEGATLTAAVTEAFVRPNGHLEMIRIQNEASGSRHFGITRARVARDARLSQYQFTLGAGLSRYDAETILEGEGADLTMNGAYLLDDDQSGDHQTVIDHAVPHCTSRELYRGILDDRSRGIFEGRVIVRPDAQKTSAEQANDNLILSETAIANSTPQLEIYADDVKCRHGSTIGRLDEESVFYLRSRGIEEDQARSILTMGFAGEVLEPILHDEMRERLQTLFVERLGGRSA